jgi:hypothetical protein
MGVHTGRLSLPLLIYSLSSQPHRMGFRKAFHSGWAAIFYRKKRADDGSGSERLPVEAVTNVSQQNENAWSTVTREQTASNSRP